MSSSKTPYQLQPFIKDIARIATTLTTIYKNIHIETEDVDELYYVPSYYKIFLLYVYDLKQQSNTTIQDEINELPSYIKSILDDVDGFNKLNDLDLSQKQLSALNILVEDKCSTILNQLQNLLLNNYEYLPTSIKKLNIPEEHLFLYNTFISFDNLETIRECCKYKLRVSYKYDAINHHFTLYLSKKDKMTLLKKNHTLLKEIATRIVFFNVFFNTTKTPIFSFYYNNLKKTLTLKLPLKLPPNKANHNKDPNLFKIRNKNVNTAATDVKTKIIIWRKEELLKSVYHECVHFHKLDIDDRAFENKAATALQNILNVSDTTEIFIREAYTELIANFLNIITYITIKLKKPATILLVNKYLNKEIKYSIETAAFILNYFKYTTFDDILKSTQHTNTIPYNQNTPSLSYYIIKSALLHSIEKTLKLNNENTLELKFNANSQTEFLNYVIELMSSTHSNTWKQLVNKELTKLHKKYKKTKKKMKSKSKSKFKLTRTLRMTSLGY